MDETQRPVMLNEPCLGKRVGRVGRLVIVELCHPRRQRQVRLAADNRERFGERARAIRQPRKAQHHRPDDAVRCDSGEPVSGRGAGNDSFDREARDQLARQEGVAGRSAMTSRHEHAVGRHAQVALDHERDRPRAQRLRSNDYEIGLGAELGKEPCVRYLVLRTGSKRDQNRQGLQPSRQVEQEAKRRRIGPARLVDGEQQRLAGGNVRGEQVERVQRREP